MKYAWKRQQISKLSAQVVGDELEKLEKQNEGALLPSTVVKAARPTKSKLHGCFEWDNRKAADNYRENQARELLRKIVIVYEDQKGNTDNIRAFVRIQHDDESYYTCTARVQDDEELQDNVLEQILAELMAVKRKYTQFKSPMLQKIWEAIDEAILAEV